MANAVAFTLITPRAIVFEGDAELVIAVGTEGEIGIMAQHAPFLTALRPGVLRATARASCGWSWLAVRAFCKHFPTKSRC